MSDDPEWIEQVRADLHRVRQTFDSVYTTKKTLQHLNKSLQSQVAALETERDGQAERIRVLREALEYAVRQVPELATVPGINAALEVTK